MNTKQIEFILELAKTQNFNRAAENLYISQSTLTYQIKAVEEEIGFPIFIRGSRGATLTPAGFQFCITLRNIQSELHDAIEQGQNFSHNYREDISIGLPVRSCIHKLPEIIMEFNHRYPDISITPKFGADASIDTFNAGQLDLMFAIEESVHRVPDLTIHPLYDSKFYLIVNKNDVLAKKNIIELDDLKGQTLMIGGGSPAKLKSLQQRIIHTVDNVSYFNSANHDTTLTNVAAHKGVCISPGFLNDYTGEFAWIPVNHSDSFHCVICSHDNDNRPHVMEFIEMLQKAYKNGEGK